MKAQFSIILLAAFMAACSPSEEDVVLHPKKVVVGATTYDFHYDKGRLYSVTTTKPGFYDVAEYSYHDTYFKEPDHRFKDEIFEIHYEPDNGVIGWGKSDTVMGRQVMFVGRAASSLLTGEHQISYCASEAKGRFNKNEYIRHKYDEKGAIKESLYYYDNYQNLGKDLLEHPHFISRRTKYSYTEDKLTQLAFFGPVAEKPYLTIDLEYDDKPGYLRQLPKNARFLPLEIPCRAHNIVSYTVKDAQGDIRKDLSYTCAYTYNKYGYPKSFVYTMLNGEEIKGYMVYEQMKGWL